MEGNGIEGGQAVINTDITKEGERESRKIVGVQAEMEKFQGM